MSGQFKYFIHDIDLIPFGGDVSIPFKWDIAHHLDYCEQHYGKNIAVLYFGDLDPKGLKILESAEKDIRAWSTVDFELVRCGLTSEQIETYDVPENPERPGQYQWEALKHEAAGEVIRNSLSEYLDLDLIENVSKEAKEQEAIWKEKVRIAMEDLMGE